MGDLPKLNETKEWFGEYRNVRYEINNFSISTDFKDCWTYYVFLNLDFMIPRKKLADSLWLEGKEPDDKCRVYYDYYGSHFINNIDFHGGCTYYSKISGFDGSARVVKIGCDYQHWNDDGCDYSLEIVTSDAKNTIDKIWEQTEIKKWCPYCGRYDLDKNFSGGTCKTCRGGK